MPSLASEHLQEIEALSGPERQKQETVIEETLASLFDGERPGSLAIRTNG